ncbi:beta-glucosidase 13-like protein [Corchorus olitorius]|uniref:Beta-glucosidase 13-like protein n=1 Tax=Corchorus olitorius TaxID=93759 RepID=A0A1R3G277_9ROSI|nr:beta-glucosidase 13-like protein [Corchorus olitorius]
MRAGKGLREGSFELMGFSLREKEDVLLSSFFGCEMERFSVRWLFKRVVRVFGEGKVEGRCERCVLFSVKGSGKLYGGDDCRRCGESPGNPVWGEWIREG